METLQNAMSKPIFENFSKDKLIKKPGGAFALMPNNGPTEANNIYIFCFAEDP